MTLRTTPFQALGINGLAIKRSFCKQSRGHRLRIVRDYSSALPKSERKLPQTRRPFRPKRWLPFGLGILLGVAGYQVYQVFSKQSRDAFIPYKLVKKDPVSSTASIFVLQPQEDPRDLDSYEEAWQKGIWNVHFKQPQLQIIRPYTPLPSQDAGSEEDAGRLRFLIRNDMYGEVSSYLHRLPIGSQIELRGPNLEYEISPEVKQVVFFAGGTGIAPALQVAHALFSSKGHGKDSKLHILWANRKREDCVGGHSDESPAEPMSMKSKISGVFSASRPPTKTVSSDEQGPIVKALEQLKERYPGQVTVEYFVNEENTWIDSDAVFKALSRFDDRDFSLGSSSPQEQRQILISGPSGFISYLAGPKVWHGGKEQQGGISKILAHAISMNPHNVKVWKV
jgi:ferredoxin-NADP reductase